MRTATENKIESCVHFDRFRKINKYKGKTCKAIRTGILILHCMTSIIKNESDPCADKSCVDIIHRLEQLNDLGCSFFLEANEFHKTIMVSSELRWLTTKPPTGTESYNIQQKANTHINDILSVYGDSPKMNMQILLCTNPKEIKENEHIVRLIKAGVDIRYKKMDNTIKICHRENTLFISYARELDQKVNSGIKYVGKKDNDPFIKRYTAHFDRDFENAQKLVVDKNGKLIFVDKPYKVWGKEVKKIGKKDIMTAAIGAIFGAILGGLVTLLLKIYL